MENKRILITGASGFIGSNLIQEFIMKNTPHTIFPVYRIKVKGDENFLCPTENDMFISDLTDELCVKSLMQKVNPDIIIHLAADANGNAGITGALNNFKATLNLANYAPQHCHFIFSSSITVYGDVQNCSEYDKKNPTSLYGASKSACEELLFSYHAQEKINLSVIRLCATVGHNMTHGLLKDMIRKLQSESQFLELFGDKPGSIKPYIHVDDVTDFIQLCVDGHMCDKIINLSSKNSISVADIAYAAMDALDIEKVVKWGGNQTLWKGDNKYLSANTMLLSHTYGKSFDSFEAIDKTFASYKKSEQFISER